MSEALRYVGSDLGSSSDWEVVLEIYIKTSSSAVHIC